MFDECLKILLIFGSLNAVARGEAEYTSTTAASNYNECYAGDLNCDWKNYPSEGKSWDLEPWSVGEKQRTSYTFEGIISLLGFSVWENTSSWIISPIFSRVDNYSCFSIEIEMNSGSKSGLAGLRIYQKPVHIALRDLIVYSDEAKKDYILFDVWGDQGDGYHNKEFHLKHFDSNFQIIVEAIYGKDPVHVDIIYMELKQRTECTGYTPYTVPTRQTTSTTISTTTTMSTTTTEPPIGENGDTITDKVTKSDTIWVDSRPASTLSNLWPTTTLPTTKQSITTQTLQEGNGCDSRNTQMIIFLLTILGIVLLIFVCVLAVVLARRRGTYRLNDLRAIIVGTSSFIDHEKKPSDARYSTKDGGDVVIDCKESKQQNCQNNEIDN